MKRMFVLFLLVGLLAFPGQGTGNAEERVSFELPFTGVYDPTIPVDIVFSLDPCLTADVELETGTMDWNEIESSSDHYSAIVRFELKSGSTSVAQVISRYARITSGSDKYVTLDDTIIFPGQLTLFGKASNEKANHPGAKGGVISMIDTSGQLLDYDVRYLYSDYDGTYSMCFWID